MKTISVAGILLWMVMTIEMTWPSMLPHGALLIPTVIGVMFWMRSASGLLLSSAALILDWIARPTLIPLCPMFLPALTALAVAPLQQQDIPDSKRYSLRIPVPLLLPVLTIPGAALLIVSSFSFSDFLDPARQIVLIVESLRPMLTIAVPFSACVSLLIRVADEFGLRRSFS